MQKDKTNEQLRGSVRYESYPTPQMVEEAGELQLALWLSFLPRPANGLEVKLRAWIYTRLAEFEKILP